ncbi:MAG TPA: polyprenyl synthetase family protein [Bacteroidaceae bacterium]|nr:polyprenyl synthetase family protein [Bacteroidaceae bacterium]
MSTLENIKQPILQELSLFNETMDEALQADLPLLDVSLRYVSEQKGKQMRPILMFLLAKLYGPVQQSTIYSAVAAELLHTASLVHDDIVDESEMRRGVQSLCAKIGSQAAVLVGDYILSTALQFTSRTQSIEIFRLMSDLGKHLAAGEILQLNTISSTTFSEESYLEVIRMKTAVLFKYCAEMALLSVDAPADDIELALHFVEKVGLCFQIRDDIFDYLPDTTGLGKPTGNDMREGKLTLPALYVLNSVDNKEMHQVAHKIKQLEATDQEIEKFTAWCLDNGGVEYAYSKMDHYMNDIAVSIHELTASCSDTTLADALLGYAQIVVKRHN